MKKLPIGFLCCWIIAALSGHAAASEAVEIDAEWLEWASQTQEAMEAEVKKILPELRERMSGAVDRLTDEDREWAERVMREAGSNLDAQAYQRAEDTIDLVAQKHLEQDNYLARARAAIEQGHSGSTLPPGVEPLYVLMTFGLGESTILNYLREAETMDTPVIFVLRGYDPDKGGIQWVVDQILAINQFEIQFQMHINPTMFRQVEAERAPVFIQEGESGVAKVRRGAVNLYAALESMESDDVDLVIGETYEIDEPDMLDVIAERIQQVDGDKIVAGARERAHKTMLNAPEDLPYASVTESYLVDPAVELQVDITTPDGTVIAEAGTVVNPLEVAPWYRQYVVFDATVEWQVRQAEQWASETALTTFIANRLPEDQSQRADLGRRLNAHVHLLDALFIRRLDLRALPSRARQDGLMVRVDVAAEQGGDT